jgi:ABC-type transporter Mla subunit MlaD
LEFQEHLQEFETLFSKLKEFSLLESQYHLRFILQKHNRDISEYIQKLSDLNQQISQLGSQPEALTKSQQLSWNFYQSPTAQNFFRFSHDLTEVTQTVNAQQEQVDIDQCQAEALQA